MLWSGYLLSDRRVAWDLARGLDLLVKENRRDGIATAQATLRTRNELQRLVRSGPSAVLEATVSGTCGTSAEAPIVTMGIRDVAKTLGISESLVRRMCRSGRLTATKDSNHGWRIDPVGIELHRKNRTP